jgi:hypothetical protein
MSDNTHKLLKRLVEKYNEGSKLFKLEVAFYKHWRNSSLRQSGCVKRIVIEIYTNEKIYQES